MTASISANGNITTSNTSACSDGGLNALNSNITTSKRNIESGDSLVGLIASLIGTGADLHKFLLFTCTGTRPTDLPAKIDGIDVTNYGQGWVEANGYYHTAYYRDTYGDVFTANKTYIESSWTWSAVSTIKRHPLIYSVTTAAEIPTATEIQNFFTGNQGITGAIVVNFVYGNTVRSTLYYCAASYAYGAGFMVSYYGSSWYKVKVANTVATITAI